MVKEFLEAVANPHGAPAAQTSGQAAEAHTVHHWLANSSWAASGILILALFWKLPDSLRKRLFSTQIEQYIDRPDYKGKAAFLDTFSKDFARTVHAYSHGKNAKIFVFIDDLDRCEAPKAADLMQAINLLIGDGNSLIFILGLDRAKVAAAIAFKFREIIPYLDPALDIANHPASIRNFGDAFLEKFIQLSFRLPISSNEAQAHRFIDSLIIDAAAAEAPRGAAADPAKPTPEAASAAAAESARRAMRIESGAESQRVRDIVMMVREMLEYSPRRIKTFLNAFRLALYIASGQGLLDVDLSTGDAEVTPERLGKFLVLTSRYPELRSILAQNPTLLYEVEHLSLGQGIPVSDLAQGWLKQPGIPELMSFGARTMAVTQWQRQYSMRDFPIRKFDSVLPGVPPPVDPQQRAGAGTARDRASREQLSQAERVQATQIPQPQVPQPQVPQPQVPQPQVPQPRVQGSQVQELRPQEPRAQEARFQASSIPEQPAQVLEQPSRAKPYASESSSFATPARPQAPPPPANSKSSAPPSNSKVAPNSKASAPARAPMKK
jgi:hypothetical protein